ncbi:PREDICTED: WD repeat-containing protein 74 isoform X2 [Tarenaya hassleriana]|uniref:WD repeat-containing protein 74 isoform X2 n=1 Tax=Tarenaya hassleriana TaxID=28532 RepID=UPI00053CA450|nr:PREDICTED: WD repeat-containing protein 74 isoform X2 [Tarenaya hassleriana]
MPRTTTIEAPGCPPLRALTFDSLGLIKVIEARGKERGLATVVDRWGEPDSSRCVLAASMNDRHRDPLLAVARKNGSIEVLNPLNGNLHFTFSVAGDDGCQAEDDEVTGLHLFRKQNPDHENRTCTLLTCKKKGDVSLRSISFPDGQKDSLDISSAKTWKACGSGDLLFAKVDGSENFALSGGKRVEVNIWDLDKCAKIWNAKSPAKDSLGIFTPTWFTSAAFLSDDNHRKFVAGTNSHQVRVYDISAQRRPVLSFDFRETAIKSVAEDTDGNTIYVGNGSGDLASFDIRTGKMMGCFVGKCSGSIRSIVRHPLHHVIASCGLDRYVRVWDVKTRQLLSSVFLKQHLTGLVFDSGFNGKGNGTEDAEEEETEKNGNNDGSEDETEIASGKRKTSKKAKRNRHSVEESDQDDNNNKMKMMMMKKKTKSKKAKHGRDLD